jgi:DNA-binding transcriptional regulator WhiA
MPEIRIANLPDGRTVEYDPQRLEYGGTVVEAFYLGQRFSDAELRLWVRDHKRIHHTSFVVGSILSGERVVDEEELKYLLEIATSEQSQFFNQALQLAMGEGLI